MKKLNKLLLIITAVALLIFQQHLYAQVKVSSDVVSSGNISGSSSTFKVSGTAGEPITGKSSNATNIVLLGFPEQPAPGGAPGRQIIVRLMNSGGIGLEGGTVQYYENEWQPAGTTNQNGICQINYTGTQTKLSFKMTYAGYTQQKSNQDISSDILFQTINMVVQLKSSLNAGISDGEVQYYATGWQAFGTTGTDGNTPGRELLPGTYSFKMAYAGYTQQKSNIDISTTNPLSYQTVNMIVGLKTSANAGIEGGEVQYYATGWQVFGTTGTNGNTPGKELLPGTYSFKMAYAGYTQQKSNVDISTTNPLIYQTDDMVVRLISSEGNGLPSGEVQYYASGWKTFGTTNDSGNTPAKELLPGSYSFKMTYVGYTEQKSNVDITVTSPLVFQTGTVVDTTPQSIVVRLEDSNGNGIDSGQVQYYASGWKAFGTTGEDGNTPGMELLPGKYSFKMTYAGYTQQKSNVDISGTTPVVFKTQNMMVKLISSNSSGLSGGQVEYYASSWKPFGTTGEDGNTPSKELLPGSYSFKMTYAGYTQQKSNIDIASVNPLVYQTQNMVVRLLSSTDNGLSGGEVQYYASSWKPFGTTGEDGNTPSKELLPGSYSFKMTYAGYTQQKSNVDISVINPVVFKTQNMVVKLISSDNSGISSGEVQYYASGWQTFGTTGEDGNTPGKQLLPGSYSFKMTYAGYTQQKSNIDISNVNPLVYQTISMRVRLVGADTVGISVGIASYYASGWKTFGTTAENGFTPAKELLPGSYSFKLLYGGVTKQKSNIDISTVSYVIFVYDNGSLYKIAQRVDEKLPAPNEFKLYSNYPNPFNPETEIRYQLPSASNVSLKIYNMIGQEIKMLVDAYQGAGHYSVKWDGTNNYGMKVTSGMYIYIMRAGSFTDIKKMTLLK